jgi:hypothetical protein
VGFDADLAIVDLGREYLFKREDAGPAPATRPTKAVASKARWFTRWPAGASQCATVHWSMPLSGRDAISAV